VKYPAYSGYKPSCIEWIGNVPKHWHIDRLKWSVSGCFNGTWGDEPDGIDDIICVRVADFNREKFAVIDEPPTIRAVEPEQRKNRLLKKGDLLIEKSGGGEKQLVGCVVHFDHVFEAVCSNFVARMPVAPGMDSRFWSYLHAALYNARLNYLSIKQTTGIQNLDSSAYLDEKVVFPSTDEQHAIADFLDAETAKLDMLIAKKRDLIDKLKERRAVLVSRTVTRGLPPEAASATGLHPIPKLKPSGIEGLGDVPEHWEIVRIGRKITLQRGIDITKDEQNEGSVPVVSSGGISSFHDKALARGPGVIVGRKGTAGAVYYIESDFWPHDTTLWVREFRDNFPKYVYYKLCSMELESFDTGSSNPTVNRNLVHPVLVSWPPEREQRAIAHYLDHETGKIDRMLAKIEEAVERLQEYRNALITAAVTGKIDVREAVA
jgi:type I restriction enzyme, S subunit